ncbi:hypothetical protein GGF32_005180, partial [Allomyces javanicus]
MAKSTPVLLTTAAAALLLALAATAVPVSVKVTLPTVTQAPLPYCDVPVNVFASVFEMANVDHLPKIRQALGEFGLCTAQQTAMFLGNIAHETARLTVFEQIADGGAGALHMIPSNWQYAFAGVLTPAISTALGGNLKRTDAIAKQLMLQEDIMYRVAGWWFTTGAGTVLGNRCNHVDKLAAAYSIAHINDAAYQPNIDVSVAIGTCVFGDVKDPGEAQRAEYVRLALAAAIDAGMKVAPEVPLP